MGSVLLFATVMVAFGCADQTITTEIPDRSSASDDTPKERESGGSRATVASQVNVGREATESADKRRRRFTCGMWCKDGNRVAAAVSGYGIVEIDVADEVSQLAEEIGAGDEVSRLTYSADNELFLKMVYSPREDTTFALTHGGMVYAFDSKWKERRKWRGADGAATGMILWDDARRIATSSWDGTVRTWECSGTPITVFRKHKVAVLSLASVGDKSPTLLSGDSGGTIIAWNGGSGTEERRMHLRGSIGMLAASSDGHIVAGATHRGQVALWRPKTDWEQQELAMPPALTAGLAGAFADGGRLILVGGAMGTCGWATDTGEVVYCQILGPRRLRRDLRSMAGAQSLLYVVHLESNGERILVVAEHDVFVLEPKTLRRVFSVSIDRVLQQSD